MKQLHRGFKIHWICDCHGYVGAALRRNDQSMARYG